MLYIRAQKQTSSNDDDERGIEMYAHKNIRNEFILSTASRSIHIYVLYTYIKGAHLPFFSLLHTAKIKLN